MSYMTTALKPIKAYGKTIASTFGSGGGALKSAKYALLGSPSFAKIATLGGSMAAGGALGYYDSNGNIGHTLSDGVAGAAMGLGAIGVGRYGAALGRLASRGRGIQAGQRRVLGERFNTAWDSAKKMNGIFDKSYGGRNPMGNGVGRSVVPDSSGGLKLRPNSSVSWGSGPAPGNHVAPGWGMKEQGNMVDFQSNAAAPQNSWQQVREALPMRDLLRMQRNGQL